MEVSDEFNPTSDHELEVQCNECTEIFPSETNLKAHLELNHIEIKTLNCHLCPFATTQRFELQNHMVACYKFNSATEDEPITKQHEMDLETRRTRWKKDLTKNKSEEPTKPESKAVQVDSKSSERVSQDENVQSEAVLENSQSKAILEKSQSNEPVAKIDYKCKLCKFETLETSSLKSHMVTGHKVDETQTDWNKYISLCKRVVTIPKNLDKSNATTDTKQDVSNKTVVEETKLTSQKPDQASMNKLSVIQEYNEKGLYMCRICNDQFDSVGELTKHVSSVHEEKKHISNSSDKLFMCTICKDQFAEMEELTEHITAVHEEKKPQNDSLKKLYLCTICRDQFADIEELVKHHSSLHDLKIHTLLHPTINFTTFN